MVSLKKEQHVREYTPEHLMDEEEAVRTFCPPEVLNPTQLSIPSSDTAADTTAELEAAVEYAFRAFMWAIFAILVLLFLITGLLWKILGSDYDILFRILAVVIGSLAVGVFLANMMNHLDIHLP